MVKMHGVYKFARVCLLKSSTSEVCQLQVYPANSLAINGQDCNKDDY